MTIRKHEYMSYRKPPKTGTAARFYHHESDDGWPLFRFIGMSLDRTMLWHGPLHLGGIFAAKCGQHIRPATRDEWRHFKDSQRNRKLWSEIWTRQQYGTVPGRPKPADKSANPIEQIRSCKSAAANPLHKILPTAADGQGQKADMSYPATRRQGRTDKDKPL